MRGLPFLLLLAAGCDPIQCGPGTIEIEDQCVPDGSAGTATATGTGTAAGTGTGNGNGTGTGTGTGTGSATGGAGTQTTGTHTPVWTGPCAPPDEWTGPVDPALFALTQYAPTYDALLWDMASHIGLSGSGSSSTSVLALGATVTLEGTSQYANHERIYVQDGLWAWAADVSTDDLNPGDNLSFGVSSYSSGVVDIWSANAVLHTTDNPVAVYDLTAENVDHDVHGARLTHMYGEITQVSGHDCAPGGNICFVVAHDGTTDLIKVKVTNNWGLDVDYAGGLCAEIVAPVRTETGDTGRMDFLDVREPTWMRTWPVP